MGVASQNPGPLDQDFYFKAFRNVPELKDKFKKWGYIA